MNDKRKRRKVAKAKMFSFHKPKVYRSTTGCCICKAKSSSSRFTDSKKYEEDFIKCFQLDERRTGEICNACVLLVKRWKKLPAGSSRNWRHVVDARAGPGIKSLTKFKAKNKKKSKETVEKLDRVLKKKHTYTKTEADREGSPAMSDESEENVAGNGSKNSSRACSPASSEDNGIGEKRLDMDQDMEISDYIDLTYFKRKNVCCGAIFVGMCGEVLIEPALYKPCLSCLSRRQQQRQQRAASVATTASSVAGSSPAHSISSASASPCHSSASASPAHSVDSVASSDGPKAKGFVSDSSSDSGYDDSSNPGDSKKLLASQQQQPPPAPPTAMMLHLLGKPAAKTQQQQQQQQTKPEAISATATALRLKGLTSGTKVPIKLLCKPVALVSSAKLSLAGGGAMSTDSVLTVVPPAVDFAVRPPAQRPSLAN